MHYKPSISQVRIYITLYGANSGDGIFVRRFHVYAMILPLVIFAAGGT